jgi:2-dehydropantoate 2-reductase
MEEDDMRAAIMGVGSLGTILGAYITKAGKQIDLIDVYEDHVKALNEKGAHVVGTIDFTVPVTALTPDQMKGQYDLVFFMVKQTYNDSAIAALKPHIHDKTIIVTLQNGLPEPAIVAAFGAERVMGCPVGWGATFKGPGVSELTAALDRLGFDLGRVDNRITPELDVVKSYLECMCPTVVLDNLMGIRWTKVLANATFSGMSAALSCTFGEVLDNDQALMCVKYIANECIDVAKAANIRMEPLQGFDLGKLLAFKTKAEQDATTQTYLKVWGAHRPAKASMLPDLEKGRKCEINAINGAVCDMGDKYGVDTPVNDQVVEIVRSIENGKLKLSFDNLKLFKLPEIS